MVKKKDDVEYEYFEVTGAGMIQLQIEPKASTGGTTGFSFGVEWGRYGYAGGVLSIGEARRLANHILDTIDSDTKQ